MRYYCVLVSIYSEIKSSKKFVVKSFNVLIETNVCPDKSRSKSSISIPKSLRLVQLDKKQTKIIMLSTKTFFIRPPCFL